MIIGSIGVAVAGVVAVVSLGGAVYCATRIVQTPEPRIINTVKVAIVVDGRQPYKLPDNSIIAAIPNPDANVRFRDQKSLSTAINIVYHTPIDINATARILVDLSQTSSDENRPLPSLPFDILLRMEGIGLDWTELDKPLKQGTSLPVHEAFEARARQPGEYDMHLALRDINHAVERHGWRDVTDKVVVTVNDQSPQAWGGSDDVPLHVSFQKYGLSARTIDWVTASGTVILSLISLGAVGKIFRPFFGWLKDRHRKDKRRPAH